MSEFKNMKIAITPEQPIDEVVRELERLGYRQKCCPNITNPTMSIRTVQHEKYPHIRKFEFLGWHINAIDDFWKITSLVELKRMK